MCSTSNCGYERFYQLARPLLGLYEPPLKVKHPQTILEQIRKLCIAILECLEDLSMLLKPQIPVRHQMSYCASKASTVYQTCTASVQIAEDLGHVRFRLEYIGFSYSALTIGTWSIYPQSLKRLSLKDLACEWTALSKSLQWTAEVSSIPGAMQSAVIGWVGGFTVPLTVSV